MATHVENSAQAPDQLYLEAKIQSAQSATGFKVSVLCGRLHFRLSRSYTARKIEVQLEGFKSVRVKDHSRVDMNATYEIRDMSERLCCITWILGEDIPIQGGQDYVYHFSGLLDARLPRTIKAGSSRIYYRMTADIPNLRNLKTETGLNVPWSRSAIMAASEEDLTYETSTIPMEHDDSVSLSLPRTVIKGPDRSIDLRFHATKSPHELNITHVDIEILQNVRLYLERLREPHIEPSTVVQSAKADFPATCSKENPLVVNLPLPAEIHAEMKNPHLSCSHVLKITIHRQGMFNRAKVHKQPIVLRHLDLDHWKGRELPFYEDVITKEFNDPYYEYSSMDRKYADEEHNVL